MSEQKGPSEVEDRSDKRGYTGKEVSILFFYIPSLLILIILCMFTVWLHDVNNKVQVCVCVCMCARFNVTKMNKCIWCTMYMLEEAFSERQLKSVLITYIFKIGSSYIHIYK